MTDGAWPGEPEMVEIDADAVDSVATAADLLYAAPSETFVAARDQLAKALRARGQRDLATEVKALRRPTMIAAELNRVLRASPADRDALMAAAQALADGQRRLLAGEVADLAGLQSAHRAAVAVLADRAGRHQGEIHAALEAASVDEALHDQLHRATFAQEPTPTRGFDLLAAAGLTASGPRPERPARPAAAGPGTRRRLPGRRAADPARPAIDPDLSAGTGAGTRAGSGPDTAAPDRDRDAEPATPAAAPPRLRSVPSPPTARELELAERRLEAARAGEDKAAQRLADAEARLDEARRHHGDTIRRREAAEAALARLRDLQPGPA